VYGTSIEKSHFRNVKVFWEIFRGSQHGEHNHGLNDRIYECSYCSVSLNDIAKQCQRKEV